MSDTLVSGRGYNGIAGNENYCQRIRRGSPAVQNTNFLLPLTYTINIEVDLRRFNPAYPRNPKSLGEIIRKARMDGNMFIKEFAETVGVTEDAVINWEIRDIKPSAKNFEKLRTCLKMKNIYEKGIL